MYDHGRANYEDRDLKQCARVALLEQAADERNAQKIELTTTQAGATPVTSNCRYTFVPSGKIIETDTIQSPAIVSSMFAR